MSEARRKRFTSLANRIETRNYKELHRCWYLKTVSGMEQCKSHKVQSWTRGHWWWWRCVRNVNWRRSYQLRDLNWNLLLNIILNSRNELCKLFPPFHVSCYTGLDTCYIAIYMSQDSLPAELCNLASGSWLAWAYGTAAHYVAIHWTRHAASRHTIVPITP